ncbi:hypothetical protein VTL71DRAFT_7465 [Oculimacula yallundae]|uniref:Uncharacterized protein n=1 Tax=Oculimacula yallundae TaxID=86028 RepID=A0ABR4BU68_9HELO
MGFLHFACFHPRQRLIQLSPLQYKSTSYVTFLSRSPFTSLIRTQNRRLLSKKTWPARFYSTNGIPSKGTATTTYGNHDLASKLRDMEKDHTHKIYSPSKAQERIQTPGMKHKHDLSEEQVLIGGSKPVIKQNDESSTEGRGFPIDEFHVLLLLIIIWILTNNPTPLSDWLIREEIKEALVVTKSQAEAMDEVFGATVKCTTGSVEAMYGAIRVGSCPDPNSLWLRAIRYRAKAERGELATNKMRAVRMENKKRREKSAREKSEELERKEETHRDASKTSQ